MFPFYLNQDPGTGAIQFLSVVPDVKIKSTSTLFSQMLGYDATLSTFESDQDGTTVRAGYDHAQPFTATQSARITAARAVQIHVPTIVASTYDRDGKLQGNQMAQVPIPLGTKQNEFVSWQATKTVHVAAHPGYCARPVMHSASSTEFSLNRSQDCMTFK